MLISKELRKKCQINPRLYQDAALPVRSRLIFFLPKVFKAFTDKDMSGKMKLLELRHVEQVVGIRVPTILNILCGTSARIGESFHLWETLSLSAISFSSLSSSPWLLCNKKTPDIVYVSRPFEQKRSIRALQWRNFMKLVCYLLHRRRKTLDQSNLYLAPEKSLNFSKESMWEDLSRPRSSIQQSSIVHVIKADSDEKVKSP